MLFFFLVRPLWLALHVDRIDDPYERVTIGSRDRKGVG